MGILILYFIAKPFYKLAEDFKKNKWGWAIIGALIYIALYISFQFIILFVFEGGFLTDDSTARLIGYVSVPIGALATWGIRKYIEKEWTKNNTTFNEDNDLLDQYAK